jgi:hypothetical protein
VSVAAITLCVVSQRVFIVVSVYFVIDSIRKLLDTPSYVTVKRKTLLMEHSTELGKQIHILQNKGFIRAYHLYFNASRCVTF